MTAAEASRGRRRSALLVWAGLLAVMLAPILIAATSPLLAYREAVHIIAGFAGIGCLALMLIQPLLAARYLPGLDAPEQRTWHRRIGTAIIVCVALHVGGLYLASPVDALDALTLAAPTPFSVYGVVAMWCVVLTAILVALRSRPGLSYARWRLIHNGLALIVVVATVLHAVQIEGAMEAISKWALCIAAVAATCVTLLHLRVVRPLTQRRSGAETPAPK